MNRNGRIVFSSAAVVAILGGSFAFAQQDSKKPVKPEMPAAAAAAQDHGMELPPGWTAEDMQACMMAGMPGEMQQMLVDGAGVWKGTCKMWMAPDTEAMENECTTVVTPILDGRYVTVEMTGEMPGMGPFKGMGINAFDNVSQKFQGTWIDSFSTQIMFGTGEINSARDTITWDFTYNCPIKKAPVKMREIQRNTGKDSMSLEMHTTDPKSGKEYKMMEISMKRVAADPHAHAHHDSPASAHAAPGMFANHKAEAGCAMCSYHMDGVKRCELAVMIDGHAYLVSEGADLVNVHQFCGSKGPKAAMVSGKLIDGKFVAKQIELANATR